MNQLLSRKQTIYAGFDPTATSLHVGNLLVLITLFHLVHHGHRVLVLVGDSTARIGDPAGKSEERPQLDQTTIQRNAEGIEMDILKVYENFKRLFIKHRLDDENFVYVVVV